MEPTIFDNEIIPKLVEAPSIGAITYQVHSIREELLAFNDEEYPNQACVIRDVFLCITEHVLEELSELLGNEVVPGNTADFQRVRTLAAIIREVHSYIRFLKSSSPQQTPPGIQLALTELTNKFFPKGNGNPISLVRPQWKYNLSYVPLSRLLESLFVGALGSLHAEERLGIDKCEDLLPALWSKYQAKRSAHSVQSDYPNQLAILSFAGLDTHDVLLYPILAHELGHFIDFSFREALHLRKDVREASEITEDHITSALGADTPVSTSVVVRKALSDRVYVSLREILADLLAVRMMGLSFFITQAEFLKTLGPLEAVPRIESSGYPNLRLRLSIIFTHLLGLPAERNPLLFAKLHSGSDAGKFLLNYLKEWQRVLEPEQKLAENVDAASAVNELEAILVQAVTRATPKLSEIAVETVPDAKCASLTATFFDRIRNLEHDLPPSCPYETDNSFAEIMSAAWVYQLKYGEQREKEKPDLSFKAREYAKTCRLILKAIELIPVCGKQKRIEVRSQFTDWPGVLDAGSILERICLPIEHQSRIGIIPFQETSLDHVSMRLHLGNWFTVARRTRVKCFEIGDTQSERLLMSLAREDVFVPYGKKFLIHPGDLVLGVTLEFVALPADLMAYVEGKSRTGRTGLIIATASKVDPGFHGGLVLELANVGTVPLEVKPGSLVGQLVFHSLKKPLPDNQLYRGEYYCQIKA